MSLLSALVNPEGVISLDRINGYANVCVCVNGCFCGLGERKGVGYRDTEADRKRSHCYHGWGRALLLPRPIRSARPDCR